MSTLEKLPRGTLAALERAVECAAEWRGAYTHDPEALAAFDAELTAMRAALRAVRKQARAVDGLLKHVEATKATMLHGLH
jgi:hypothetical protein